MHDRVKNTFTSRKKFSIFEDLPVFGTAIKVGKGLVSVQNFPGSRRLEVVAQMCFVPAFSFTKNEVISQSFFCKFKK